jgi:hypothetical protein
VVFTLASLEILGEIYRYIETLTSLALIVKFLTMKTKPSSYVLAAEILTIILLHAAKIKQAERHHADTALMHGSKNIAVPKPAAESKTDVEYMLVNLVK